MRKVVPASLAYGVLLYLILPPGIVALNDDFGYLRSVVQTLQHGRPWTDDWLEPWAAGFSSLSALLYLATGSFHFATYGLLALLGAVLFGGAVLLLRDRGVAENHRLVIAALLLTTPTVFWKSVEFTGLALYLPCLLLAVWASSHRRWFLFLVVWGLALSTRQSALAWAVLPAVAVFESWWRQDPGNPERRWPAPLLVLAAGGALFVGLHLFMNKTRAQFVVTDHLLAQWSWPRAGETFAVGAAVFVVAAGLGASVLAGQGAVKTRRSIIGKAVVCLGALALLVPDARAFTAYDHAGLDGPVGWLYTKLMVLVAAVLWFGRSWSIRPVAGLAALGALAVVCLRPAPYDYYFLDVAVFGFFGVAAGRATGGDLPRSGGHRAPGARIVLGALAAFHLLFVLHFKAQLDRNHALTVLGERALREGRLAPEELSFLPFGLMGWHLFPHHMARGGPGTDELGDFGRYLRGHTVDIGGGYSRVLHLLPRFRHEPPADRSALIVWGRFRFCWFFHQELYFLRVPPEKTEPPRGALDPHYRLPPFPADDAGWRNLIHQFPQ